MIKGTTKRGRTSTKRGSKTTVAKGVTTKAYSGSGRISAADAVLKHLSKGTAAGIAKTLGISASTVVRHLSAWRKAGKAYVAGGGRFTRWGASQRAAEKLVTQARSAA